MTFGWEGFSFEHPEDWAPVVLSGDRSQGYARIVSSGRILMQARWKRLKQPADANRFLDAYLGRLERDSKRARVPFTSERQEEGDRTTYRYAGQNYGRGALFQVEGDDRAFVLEISSSRNDSLQSFVRDALRTFRIDPANDRWSVFGLDLTLPLGLKVDKREFLAGKTRLEWTAGRRARISATRYGFADQLLSKHKLGEWAEAVVGAPVTSAAEEDDGVRLTLKGRGGGFDEALATHQPKRNQLVVLRATARDERWRPTWDWLT